MSENLLPVATGCFATYVPANFIIATVARGFGGNGGSRPMMPAYTYYSERIVRMSFAFRSMRLTKRSGRRQTLLEAALRQARDRVARWRQNYHWPGGVAGCTMPCNKELPGGRVFDHIG